MTLPIDPSILQPVSSLVRSALSTDSAETTESATQEDQGFEQQLRALLSPSQGNTINEEELFAGLIQQRIQASKGAEAASMYEMKFNEHKANLTRGDGYVNVEKAAKMALSDMVSGEHLTSAEASQIRAHAFQAAQLDDNHDALFDGRGSEGDDTVATADLETALVAAQAMIESLENGEVPLDTTTTGDDGGLTDEGVLTDEGTLATEGGGTNTPVGNEVDGSGGFVFKPESEHERKLVVLLPTNFTGAVDEVLLKDMDDNILEKGRGSGVANGNREHIRFEKAGQDYPENIKVEVRLTNGEIETYEIPNPGQRYD